MVKWNFLGFIILAVFDFGLSHMGSSFIQNLARVTRYDGSLQNVIDFVNLKVGSSKQSYWHYSGMLRNPLTGREIVGIEGVEIVRSVPVFPRRKENDTFATAFLSKKMFMYVDKNNGSNLIEHFRLQRQAPLRPVKSFSEMSQKVTLGVDSRGQTFASIAWPGSQRTTTNNQLAITSASKGTSFVDQLVGRKKLDVINFMTAGVPIHKIPRNSLRRWISFSPGGHDDRAGRSQEYYTISNIDALHVDSLSPATAKTHAGDSGKKSIASMFGLRNPTKPEAVLTYQRHGEGPAWYAVGRACIVELTGARYSSEKALPSYVRDLVQRANPAFFDLSVPNKPDDVERGNNDNISANGMKETVAKRSTKQTLLTPQWFDAQSDPADKYKPWYSHIHTFFPSIRK